MVYYIGTGNNLEHVFARKKRREMNVKFLQKKKEQRDIIVFCNEGDNISKEQLSTIFQKFVRLDEARTSDGGETGSVFRLPEKLYYCMVEIFGRKVRTERFNFLWKFHPWQQNNRGDVCRNMSKKRINRYLPATCLQKWHNISCIFLQFVL